MSLKSKISDKQQLKRKKKINYYYETISIFFTIIFLNLLGILTINIGCKVLNPAFTISVTTGNDSTDSANEPSSASIYTLNH